MTQLHRYRKKKTSQADELYVKDPLPELQHQQTHTSQIITELMTKINRRRPRGRITTHHYCSWGFAGVLVHPSCSTLLCSNQNIPSLLSLCPSSPQPSPPVTLSLWHLSQAFILITNSATACSDHWLYCRSLKRDPFLWLTRHKRSNILLKYYPANAWHERHEKQLTSWKCN